MVVKLRKQITLISLISFVIYNIIIFLIPSIKSTTFWVACIFSNLSIIITSLVILGALDEQGIKKKFNSMPIVYVALTYVILQLIIGMVEIYHPINYRYSILINVILLGFCIIGLLIVNAGKKEIERVNEKVEEKVFFIKELQADIETFVDKITDENTKEELNLLVDTIKYSDPMSHSQLSSLENQIVIKVKNLTQTLDNNENVKQICGELQQLFAERNRKAKIYKNQPEQTMDKEKPLNFKLIIAVILSIVVLIVVAVTLYFTIIIPNKQYYEAMSLYNNKQYIQAKEAFEKLGDYKDSQEKQKQVMYVYAIELFNKQDYENAEKEFERLGDYSDSKDKKNQVIYQKATELLNNKEYSEAAKEFFKLDNYKDAKDKVIEIYNLFGEEDVIYFGTYNGQPIAWQILETKENKVLLITKEPIDEMAYNTEYKAIDWNNSSIRKWLNEDFYNSFNAKEKDRILKNTNETDNVFLLSDKNVEEYTKLKKVNTSWWISTNGDETTKAMFVTENGIVNTTGDIVTKLHGVRPAIWLNLD